MSELPPCSYYYLLILEFEDNYEGSAEEWARRELCHPAKLTSNMLQFFGFGSSQFSHALMFSPRPDVDKGQDAAVNAMLQLFTKSPHQDAQHFPRFPSSPGAQGVDFLFYRTAAFGKYRNSDLGIGC